MRHFQQNTDQYQALKRKMLNQLQSMASALSKSSVQLLYYTKQYTAFVLNEVVYCISVLLLLLLLVYYTK